MSAKAAAFKEYREAAMVDMMLKVIWIWIYNQNGTFHRRFCHKLLLKYLDQSLMLTRSPW